MFHILTYDQAVELVEKNIFNEILRRYELEGYDIRRVEAHVGGRNLVYDCRKEGTRDKMLRIAFIEDRSPEDLLAELEYIRYLSDHGGSVSNVVESITGKLLEEIEFKNERFMISLFEKAVGDQIADHYYQYREGIPLTEYFYNCGKVLGKLHQLSKEYTPVHKRIDYFDKYNMTYINELIPDIYADTKKKIGELLKEVKTVRQDKETYGMVHFDFSDGNYMIDYNTGEITVYDFDNSCFCWYLFDLANLWTHGVGWIQFEPDAAKRKQYMDKYFDTIVKGYRSETALDDAMLEKLPLFIQIVLIENIVDEFEVMRQNGEEPECDEEMRYQFRCIEKDIPYEGFFGDMYSCDAPFELAE